MDTQKSSIGADWLARTNGRRELTTPSSLPQFTERMEGYWPLRPGRRAPAHDLHR